MKDRGCLQAMTMHSFEDFYDDSLKGCYFVFEMFNDCRVRLRSCSSIRTDNKTTWMTLPQGLQEILLSCLMTVKLGPPSMGQITHAIVAYG